MDSRHTHSQLCINPLTGNSFSNTMASTRRILGRSAEHTGCLLLHKHIWRHRHSLQPRKTQTEGWEHRSMIKHVLSVFKALGLIPATKKGGCEGQMERERRKRKNPKLELHVNNKNSCSVSFCCFWIVLSFKTGSCYLGWPPICPPGS